MNPDLYFQVSYCVPLLLYLAFLSLKNEAQP